MPHQSHRFLPSCATVESLSLPRICPADAWPRNAAGWPRATVVRVKYAGSIETRRAAVPYAQPRSSRGRNSGARDRNRDKRLPAYDTTHS